MLNCSLLRLSISVTGFYTTVGDWYDGINGILNAFVSKIFNLIHKDTVLLYPTLSEIFDNGRRL